MPRKSKQQIADEKFATEIAQAIAAHPFAPDRAPTDSTAFEAQTPEVQRAIVASIARDKASGLSGAELRARYSGPGCPTNRGLSGPLRRKLLRTYGLDSAATIARSYSAYSDGQARAGSAHAREHGPHAAERQAEALRAIEAQAKAQAEREAREAQKAQDRAMRDALRAAGVPVPRGAKAMREAYAAMQA